MQNELKIQQSQPIDENLKPITVGNETSSLEISSFGNGAKVTGDLDAKVDKIHLNNTPAYSGMIIGYTEIYDTVATDETSQTTTTSFAVLRLTFDSVAHHLKVKFIVPPSGNVKISVNLPYCTGMDATLWLGLATDTAATTLHEDYERGVWDVDETDIVGINYHWIVKNLEVGTELTYYAMMKEGTAGGRAWCGDGAFVNYGAWTMEAMALPHNIGDGS